MSSSDRAALVSASALAACMVAWAVVLPLAPWASRAGPAGAALSALADGAGALVCHQKPDRSFEAGGQQWAVCARCTGIYLAAGAGVLFGLAFLAVRVRLVGRSAAAWRAVFAVALFPVALTWALERAGLAPVSNIGRALSGVPLGLALAAVVLASLCPRLGDRPQ